MRRRLVAQRIHAGIFPDPLALARNLECVTEHLGRVWEARNTDGVEPRPLELVRGPDGQSVQRDRHGDWWRAFPFVSGSRSIERAGSPRQAEQLAAAFGAFLADLDGLDPERMAPILPGFHDLPGRLAALEEALRRDSEGRAQGLGDELERARQLAASLETPDSGALPHRVVHNDCKLNNLLVDERLGTPLCVIDLDTVMPGQARFDFGELVRTAAATADEDEPDPERVGFDLDLFRALAEGFVSGARGLLSRAEIRSLGSAGPRMALENAVRFLSDDLDGDRYFPAQRPRHNRDRARAQLRLCERMLEADPECRVIVEALEGHGR